ncbi:MAG: hypothetical protein ACEPOW_11855 [Bacteroidales bacterium]
MKKVVLNYLKCSETEDCVGYDECNLKIYKEGKILHNIGRDMKEGDVWNLSCLIIKRAEEKLTAKLWDKDNPMYFDDHDLLGEVQMHYDNGEYNASFNKDGANYVLNYDVSDYAVQDMLADNLFQRITLKKLVCKRTEDYSTDECTLKIYRNGALATALKKDMKKGRQWNLNLDFYQWGSDNYVLNLIDRDFGYFDKDDNLGKLRVSHNPGNYTFSFNKDGALYILYYSITNDIPKHKLGKKLHANEIIIESGELKGNVHTYLIGYSNDGSEFKRWNAFGRDEGGHMLEGTLTSCKDTVDLDSVNFMMTEPPCAWPEQSYYGIVGVCWNLCNRGLYFTHKTVENVKHYAIVEALYGTYGLDEGMETYDIYLALAVAGKAMPYTEFQKLVAKAKRMYSWTKAREYVQKYYPWQGKPITDFEMFNSPNPRIKLYHQFFGKAALQQNVELEDKKRWKLYTEELLSLNIKEKIGKLPHRRMEELKSVHDRSFDVLKQQVPLYKEKEKDVFDSRVKKKDFFKKIIRARYINTVKAEEKNLNLVLKSYKDALTDKEYEKLFLAKKNEKFKMPL